MGPGQATTMPKRRPSSGSSANVPCSMSTKIDAWQKLCVGRRLNWQGHPHSQLQLTISVPLMVHSGSIANSQLPTSNYQNSQYRIATPNSLKQQLPSGLDVETAWELEVESWKVKLTSAAPAAGRLRPHRVHRVLRRRHQIRRRRRHAAAS